VSPKWSAAERDTDKGKSVESTGRRENLCYEIYFDCILSVLYVCFLLYFFLSYFFFFVKISNFAYILLTVT
jgi:hypothetical protein